MLETLESRRNQTLSPTVVEQTSEPRVTTAEEREQPNSGDPDTTKPPSSKWPTAKSWPTLKITGADITHGTILSIECRGRSWTLLVQSQGAVRRYLAPNIEKIEFYSQSYADDKIGCGPVNKPAFVYFKPAAATESKLAGELLALEFTKP
jgi:hypothetical protein